MDGWVFLMWRTYYLPLSLKYSEDSHFSAPTPSKQHSFYIKIYLQFFSMTEEPGVYFSSSVVNCVLNAFLSYNTIMLNIVTIHVLRKTPSLPKTLKTLLFSLTISDLLVGLLVEPLHIVLLVKEMHQDTSSKVYTTMLTAFLIMVNFLSFASFFSVVAISADRFLAIYLHLRYQELVTSKRVFMGTVSIWIFSASFSISGFRWAPENRRYIIFASVEVLCYVCTGIFYYKLYAAVQCLTIQGVAQDILNIARQKKSAFVTFFVYLVFLVCYLPKTCLNIIVIILEPSKLIYNTSIYVTTLMFVNSCLNPLIYSWKMKHIRRNFVQILITISSPRKSVVH